MEKYQFKIGDVIIRTPEGWQDFTLTLKRDEDISGLLVSSTNKFIFWGDGYDILKERFDANYSDKVFVTINILQADKTYKEQYFGVVILTEVLFNLEKKFAEATVEDSSFQGAIQGNKNIKSFINAGITKNSERVNVPTLFNLDYFNDAGVYQSLPDRRAYLLSDAIDFLVRFMTDNEVKGIQSTYLNNKDNWSGVLPYITTGLSIRLATQDAPNVSFAQLMIFLQRTHDLTFDFVTDAAGDTVMRIEESEFFFQKSSIDTIRDIADLTVKVDSSRVASHLEIGNNNSFDAGNCSSTTRFFQFGKEDYSLRGKGNIDKLLDLTTDIITDSNVIGAIVNSASEAFDDDIIVVLGILDGTQAALYTNVTHCSNNPMYNFGFTNDKIIDRQLHAVPNSVTKYLTAATTPSKAGLDTDIFNDFGGLPAQVTIQVDRGQDVNMPDESYDLGGRYSTANPNNTFYDVPFAGVFSFEAGLRMAFSLQSVFSTSSYVSSIDFAVSIQRWDSTFTTLKETIAGPKLTFGLSYPFPVGGIKLSNRIVSGSMTCAAGERVIVRLGLALTTALNTGSIIFKIEKGQDTFFTCLGAAADAGVYKDFNPNSFRSRQYKFEKNLSLTRTDNIRANSRNSIIINELSDTELDKETWIEEMVNNIETSRTSFTTIN